MTNKVAASILGVLSFSIQNMAVAGPCSEAFQTIRQVQSTDAYQEAKAYIDVLASARKSPTENLARNLQITKEDAVKAQNGAASERYRQSVTLHQPLGDTTSVLHRSKPMDFKPNIIEGKPKHESAPAIAPAPAPVAAAAPTDDPLVKMNLFLADAVIVKKMPAKDVLDAINSKAFEQAKIAMDEKSELYQFITQAASTKDLGELGKYLLRASQTRHDENPKFEVQVTSFLSERINTKDVFAVNDVCYKDAVDPVYYPEIALLRAQNDSSGKQLEIK